MNRQEAEDKQLLLADLCARLPYNLVINCTEEDDEKTNFNCFLAPDMIKDIMSETAYWIIKPYLRPMSSMTEEERGEFENLVIPVGGGNAIVEEQKVQDLIEFYLKNHLDYRGLIPKGLALEAPKDMYK